MLARSWMLPPVVAAVAVIATLVACVVIAKTNDRYLGGLAWPYFSDMGRDSPGYAVFCAGLTAAATALVLAWGSNRQFQRQVATRELQERAGDALEKDVASSVGLIVRLADAGAALGIASAVGLPVLSFFSTASFPDVHQYAAYWFFVLEAGAVVVNTLASYRLMALVNTRARVAGYDEARSPPLSVVDPWDVSKSSVRRTFFLQAAIAGLFLVAFVLYLPIGLAIIEPFKRLTIQECLDRDLGAEYCSVTMKRDAVDTKLWNYEHDVAANELRAGSQLACILALVGYSLSFLTHDRDAI